MDIETYKKAEEAYQTIKTGEHLLDTITQHGIQSVVFKNGLKLDAEILTPEGKDTLIRGLRGTIHDEMMVAQDTFDKL